MTALTDDQFEDGARAALAIYPEGSLVHDFIADARHHRVEVKRLRSALQILVACEGGRWSVERYARERSEALAGACAALAGTKG